MRGGAPPRKAPTGLVQEINAAVIHEDPRLLVINKPAGLVVHPAAGHWSGTLLNALLAREIFGSEHSFHGVGETQNLDADILVILRRLLGVFRLLGRRAGGLGASPAAPCGPVVAPIVTNCPASLSLDEGQGGSVQLSLAPSSAVAIHAGTRL